jgi:glycosyltransferase involved in cell wall biosynthesis
MYTLIHTEWSKGWGGQEIRVLDEAISFSKRGYRVSIISQPDSQLYAKASNAGIESFPVKMHKWLSLAALLKIFKIIKKQHADIIHTHSSVDARIAGIAARAARIPVVRSRHLSTDISKSWLSWFLYMKLADHVITSGSSIRERMISHNNMRPEQITSIPAGVDESRFAPINTDISLRESLGLSPEHFVVGIVAVLRSWKGHDTLLKAIAEIKKDFKEIRLLVLGDGPQKANLMNLAEKLEIQNEVQFLGHIQDTPKYYSILDAVILNSYANEATSQTLPQAMLMGLPVIGTNIGSIPEVIHNRVTGLLIKPNSPSDIVRAILEVNDNVKLTSALIENGRKHALSNFTKTKMLNATESIYKKVSRNSSVNQ